MEHGWTGFTQQKAGHIMGRVVESTAASGVNGLTSAVNRVLKWSLNARIASVSRIKAVKSLRPLTCSSANSRASNS